MRFKTCPAFKATNATDSGEFEAIVSVFGNIDSYGDVVLPGAFKESLAEWKASGDPIPVLWSHRMDDPRFNIGSVLDAAELAPGDSRIPEWCNQWVKDHGGLWVKGQIDVGADASDVAIAGRKLLQKRLVTQFSYAYDVLDGGWGEANGTEAYELRRVKLYEVSPTQIGANDLTQLVGAKASSAVVSRLATMGADELRESIVILGKALAARDGSGASESAAAKDEEPVTVKSEEPLWPNAESIRLLSDVMLMDD